MVCEALQNCGVLGPYDAATGRYRVIMDNAMNRRMACQLRSRRRDICGVNLQWH